MGRIPCVPSIRRPERLASGKNVEDIALKTAKVFDIGELDEYLAKMPDAFPAELGYGGGFKFVSPLRSKRWSNYS
jgi:hypothetical protein